MEQEMMFTIGLILLSLLLVSAVGFHYYVKNRCKSLENLPGPPPNLLFGNLLQIALAPAEGHLAVGLKFFEEYGPKLKVFAGPFKPYLMVADEKLLKFILSSSKFTRKPVDYETFRNWLGSGLLINEGSDWKRKRRMVAPSFHNSLLHNYFGTFERIGDIFIRKLEPEVGKESYDIMPLSSLLTLDIIYESALGESLNAQENSNMAYVECVETVCGIVSSRMKSPLPYLLFPLTLDYWRERKAIKVMHKRTNEIIDRRRKEAVLDIDQHNDGSTKRMAFLDLLLGSTVDGRPLTTDELRDEIETFIFGGAHTVAVVVAFTIHCLAHNPEVQKKAVDEQMAIFGVITNAQPTFSDLDKMEYLDMVIMECMRLYPPVPGIMRDLSQGFEYEGNTYQRVTMIAVIMAAHRNPKNFPDPLKFNPDRFKDYDSKNSFAFLPFSAGPRQCMGRKFAMVELKSVLSKFLRNYEVLPATPPQPLVLMAEVVLVSKTGAQISIKKRGVELNGNIKGNAD